MLLIKRYPNRKLYNTETKKYITLDGIAKLIRQGEEVQVVDHATGENLTAVTLSQIIFEQEKKQGGFLPRSVLAGLIQAGGDTLGNLRHSLVNSLGLLGHVDAEIEHRLQALVQQGKLAEEEAQNLLKQLLPQDRQSSDLSGLTDEDIERVLAKRGVPSRAELQEISNQLETLMAKLDGLSQEEDNAQ